PRHHPMPAAPLFCWHLATAFLQGDWLLGGLVHRGGGCLDEVAPWLPELAQRILTAFPDEATRPDAEALALFIHRDRAFRAATERVFRERPAMGPSPWPVPPLASPAALAAWLGLSPGELDWFADCQG